MANEGILEGFRCPNCGQEERFEIDVMCTLEVYDDSARQIDTKAWNSESPCVCGECDYSATVLEFTESEVSNGQQ